MKLIIAEKPMLARAIAAAIDGPGQQHNGYTIKGDYVIISAFGHLLTLKDPEDYDAKYKQWRLSTLPIYFEDWGKKPGEGKEERLNLIGSLLKDADEVIHAGDPDDEGQYLIDEILQWFQYTGPVYRLATGDTTEAALKKALANMKDNRDFVNFGKSAHARSVADIMVGYNFSRYFSLKNSHVKMLTVGRVQTPTLGLVVTRDLLIENHEKQGYFTLLADIKTNDVLVTTKFEPLKDDPNLEDGKITDKEYIEDIAKGLQGKDFDHIQIVRKSILEQPPLPFNLVKLQSYCSGKFGYDPSKTLAITQSLRDNHNAITYNRSDCQYLSEEQYKESQGTIRQVLENLSSDPAGSVFAKLPLDTSLHSGAFNDKNITAHTAIIPQQRRLDMHKLTEEERNVYLAITKYYMAQFLPAAEKEKTSLEISFDDGLLKAASTKVLSPGYLLLIKPEKKKAAEEEEEESSLSSLPVGTFEGRCEKTSIEAKETKAPPRYTKASLNEDMTRIAKYVTDPKAKALLLAKDKEKKGENGSIGTSATRSYIIDALEERGFIISKGKQIQSTVLGRELYRILPDELKKPDMTGYWWAIQEEIQDGEVPWTALTDSVLEMIQKVIKTPYPKVDAYHVPESMRRGKLLLGTCPRCGSDIVEGSHGYGCAGFKNGCKFVIWKNAKSGMMSKIDITADMVHDLLSSEWIDEEKENEQGEIQKSGAKRTKAALSFKNLYSESKKTKYSGRVYLLDEGSEYGASFRLEEILREPPKPLGKCPRCGKDIIEGKMGYGCSGYKEGCKFIIWKKAKSGMMSKTKVTKGVVKKLLSGGWVPEEKDGEKTGRMRTEKEVHMKRLYSENKEKKYTGDVYLTDEGAGSDFGSSFALARFTDDAVENLGKCPRCGKDIIEGNLSFGCSGFRDGCRFTLWKKAKSGLFSKTTVSKTMAKTLLKSEWIPEEKNGQPTGRMRTKAEVHVKTLYSEAKDQTYTGDIYLVDEGPTSEYGASLALARFTNDGPEVLGKCPRCGKDVIEGDLGFGCTGYRDGCRFTIWKKQKQKFLADAVFTKTDAKKFLAGKPVKKSKLTDKKNQKFAAQLLMIEETDNPYGPVFRVLENTIEVKEGDPSMIKIDTISLLEENKKE